jgi:hypothetical protein
MVDGDFDSLSDPNYFLFTGHIFVIAPFPRPNDQREILQKLVRMSSSTKDGQPGMSVVIFSDLDLAKSFVEQLGSKGHHQKPLTFPSLDDFVGALKGLLILGDTHVGIDPGGARVRRISIARILEAIHNRQQ